MNEGKDNIESKLSSHFKDLGKESNVAFPIGTEYYRPPVPPTRLWDDDFARISDAGFTIIRTFPYWNVVEPEPEKFYLEDIDLFMELAQKHNLKAWIDLAVGTHGACPEWLIQRYPDMRIVRRDGSIQQQDSSNATPQGSMIHNFDHPKWCQYAERYIRAIVERYKDHPNLLVWGTWDGIGFAGAWISPDGYPPYNDYTIAKYKAWLKKRYTLEQLNERLRRRFGSWEHFEPIRSNNCPSEMLLYRQFHYENMANHLGWMADLIDRIDGKHEQRSHGYYYPKPSDEVCSERIDGWGLSFPTADTFTSDDPYCVATRCFGFQWSRSVGRNGRWWAEEIYSNNHLQKIQAEAKQSIPEELTALMWLSLIEGAAGALFWQYRPEYLGFEGPRINLMALDGGPTKRWIAVKETVAQINAIAEHLPLNIPTEQVAVGFSAISGDFFAFGNKTDCFHDELVEIHTRLWSRSIPLTVVSPSMDWSKYKAVYLPNFAALDDAAISRIRETLADPKGPTLIADGLFAVLSGNCFWSFKPPEGLDDIVNVRIADFEKITERDIRQGNNIVETEYGKFEIKKECDYAVLEPHGQAKTTATLNGNVIAVKAANDRLNWWGLSLATAFNKEQLDELVPQLFGSCGIVLPVTITGDRLVAYRRISKLGGSLIFLLNVEPGTAEAIVKPNWSINTAVDLLEKDELEITDDGFRVKIKSGQVKVIHTADV